MCFSYLLYIPFITPYTSLWRLETASSVIGIWGFCSKSQPDLFSLLFTEGDEVGTGITDDNEDENSANQIAGKIPNFCVLLHGSLKVEGMVAIVQLG